MSSTPDGAKTFASYNVCWARLDCCFLSIGPEVDYSGGVGGDGGSGSVVGERIMLGGGRGGGGAGAMCRLYNFNLFL